MTTSTNFDKVLFPVDQSDVIVRTFNDLAGFNKKKRENRKGKYVKAIKEEENFVWDPVLGKLVDNRAKNAAREAAFNEKKENGGYKIVNLDRKKKTTTSSTKKEKTEKPEEKKYTGTLINKVGKTEAQIKQELKDKISGKTTVKDAFKDDTDYTVKEMVDYFWKKSSKVRARYSTERGFEQALKTNKSLRDKANAKLIEKLGSKEIKEKKARTTKTQKQVEKPIDTYKLSQKMWELKDTPDGKRMTKQYFGDGKIKSRQQIERMLEKDPGMAKNIHTVFKAAGVVNEALEPGRAAGLALAKQAIKSINKALRDSGTDVDLITDGKIYFNTVTPDNKIVNWSAEIGNYEFKFIKLEDPKEIKV